jgi:hypothetical protein
MINIGSLLRIVFVVPHLKLLSRLLFYKGYLTLALPISWTRTIYWNVTEPANGLCGQRLGKKCLFWARGPEFTERSVEGLVLEIFQRNEDLAVRHLGVEPR